MTEPEATQSEATPPEAFEPGADPRVVFEAWFAQAQREEPMAESVGLATASVDGAPSVRMVLFRGFVREAFAFYTNYQSRKARDLDANPRAALCFHWGRSERQVRVEGGVDRATRQESEAYFASRPRESQLGAWASAQSTELGSRAALLSELDRVRTRFGEGEVPCPPHWGGYRLVPETIEFWQGRASRLHDRLLYRPEGKGWTITRLAP